MLGRWPSSSKHMQMHWSLSQSEPVACGCQSHLFYGPCVNTNLSFLRFQTEIPKHHFKYQIVLAAGAIPEVAWQWRCGAQEVGAEPRCERWYRDFGPSGLAANQGRCLRSGHVEGLGKVGGSWRCCCLAPWLAMYCLGWCGLGAKTIPVLVFSKAIHALTFFLLAPGLAIYCLSWFGLGQRPYQPWFSQKAIHALTLFLCLGLEVWCQDSVSGRGQIAEDVPHPWEAGWRWLSMSADHRGVGWAVRFEPCL